MDNCRVGIVTGRTIGQNLDLGGPDVRLLQVMITDESDVQTVQLIGQMGEESNPPNGTLVALLGAGNAFKLAIASDEGVVPDLAVGGKRIFAVDDEGVVIGEVRLDPDGKITLTGPVATQTLLPDGTVTVDNGAGSFTMSPAGVFTFRGTASNFDHTVTAPNLVATVAVTAPLVAGTTDVTFAGKSAAAHTHGGVQPGSGSTGAPT